MSRFGLPKHKRLLTAQDYRWTFEKARRFSSSSWTLIVRYQPQDSLPRLGLAIAKKQISLAVKRNLLKRLAREVFRLYPLDLSFSVVVMAKKGAQDRTNGDLRAELMGIFQQIQRTSRTPRPQQVST